jgi:hypothetical protein
MPPLQPEGRRLGYHRHDTEHTAVINQTTLRWVEKERLHPSVQLSSKFDFLPCRNHIALQHTNFGKSLGIKQAQEIKVLMRPIHR